MVYTGYDLTERLAMLESTPRYGAGAIWLYQPFFALFGIDHTSIQLGNRLLGALTFVPLAVIVLRAAGSRQGLWVLLAYVLLPLVWRDHTSEGIMTGTMWLMFSALAAFIVGFSDRNFRTLLPVGVCLAAAAATVRPEAGPALFLGGAGMWLFCGPTRDRPHAKELIYLGLAFLALLVSHGIWLFESAQTQIEDTSILGTTAASSVVTSVLTDQNLLFDPTLFPIPWWCWILAAPFAKPRQWRAIGAMLLAATVWIAMSAVDLPTVSVPRVHLPAIVFLALPMAMGASALTHRKGINILVAIVACGAGLLTGPKLLASSNAQEEEHLIRKASEHLTNPDSCLATISFSDPPPPGKTQRHFPKYLFPDATVLGLSQYKSQESFCKGDRIALLGTRCFMSLRPSDELDGPTDGELQVCRRFRKAYRLEALHEVTIPNRREFTFNMYPAQDELRVGVYRILGSADSE